LVTVSEYTRSKVLRCFGIPTERVTVIPNSLPDNWYVRKPRPIAERGSYILSVTGEAPSKNLPALLRAFALVCESLKGHEAMPQLLIIGISPSQHSHFQKMASRIGVIGAVNFTSYIPEAELQRLYREATLFVMPSLYEGFGIPVLEAMASGTAVASSNATSLPEVVGNAGWLFDPRDVEDMAHTLCTAWKSPSGRYEYALRGLEQAQRFRRSTIARQIADFWEDKK
jgi:glycosyltransferase involved in cell wall biosynthesis